MLLELGPVDASTVQNWTRCARRVVCELRVDPAELAGVATPDFLDRCTDTIDRWERDALTGQEFRWSEVIEPELAEYMLHGLDRCLRSPTVVSAMTDVERDRHEPFTMHVVQALVDGLSVEGRCSEHLCDQVRASFGELLDH